MNKVNVVGGSGFIGTRLCKRFEARGIDFRIIDKRIGESFPKNTEIADVRNLDELSARINGNVIVNLAAEHRDDVTPISLYDEVNVDGARRVCEVAEQKGIDKIVFTSSVAVYGFAPVDTSENGDIGFFNDYGRTKFEAEKVYKDWQSKDPDKRCLVIIRPTVVFGERNRGNVYNLLKQISSGRFIMIGKGNNRKSLAYVENVAAFLEFSLDFKPGVHLYNYVDKPDMDMNSLVALVYRIMGKHSEIKYRIPYTLGLVFGQALDVVASVTNKKFPISKVRVEKFCKNTSFSTSVDSTGFIRPVSLIDALNKTVKFEFLEENQGEIFFSE